MTLQYFIGSFTESMGGQGRGISVHEHNADGTIGELIQEIQLDSPAYLVITDEFVFAACDPDSGLASFRRIDGRLEHVSSGSSGGADPCHIRFEPSDDGGGRLYSANYTAGTTAMIPVSRDGVLGEPVVGPVPTSPTGPEPGRQETRHAHNTEASERGTVLTAELGIDRLVEYDWSEEATPRLLVEHPMPAGSGPRHLAWAGDRLLLVGELDSNLYVLERRGDLLEIVGVVPTTDPDRPGERTFPAHVELGEDGRFAYVSNRHRDTLAVFDLADLADGGLPRLVQEVSAEGVFPRHFSIRDGALVLANTFSNSVSVFPIESDGRLGTASQTIETASPTFVTVG